MLMVRIRFGLLLIIMSLLCGLAQANHVKCKCPNIDARATGSTSCSASESSGICTISFNEFDDRLELTARDLLSRVGNWKEVAYSEFPANDQVNSPQSFTRKNARLLSSKDPASLIDQIMIYSLVALVDSGKMDDQAERIADVHALLRRNASVISAAFVSDGQRIEDQGVIVQMGCFEFKRDNFWAMYKASWSVAISNEQC